MIYNFVIYNLIYNKNKIYYNIIKYHIIHNIVYNTI